LLLELLRDLVWGLPTVGLILGFGLYFTVRSRCIQLRGLKTLARETLRGKHASEKAASRRWERFRPRSGAPSASAASSA